MSARILKGLVRAYQILLSPIFGGACRFTPTCSEYAIQAIDRYGARRGMGLAVRRLMRCHPFGPVGHDPVPDLDEGGSGRAG